MVKKIVYANYLRLFFLCSIISFYGLGISVWASEKNETDTKKLDNHVHHHQGHVHGHSDHTNHAEHEHVHQCRSDCEYSSHSHDQRHSANHTEHEHIHHHHHHHHGHTHGHVCSVCGGDHDESEHHKELERVKFETIDVKYSILKNRTIGTVIIAIILALVASISKVKG